MAYLDLREPIQAAAFRPAPPVVAAGFADQEWEVIRLARNDGLATLREPSRLARLIGQLFGADFNRALANPRLEALRRLAVLAWHHGYAVPVSAIKAFKSVGFSLDQLEILLASVATSRVRRPAPGRRAVSIDSLIEPRAGV
jgi:hypothetical protein